MKTAYIILFVSVLSMVIVAVPATASDKGFSFRLGAVGVPLITGDAGSGEGAPAYDDAFKTGYGAMFEAVYRYSERFSLLGGLGYERYDGREHEGIKFSLREVVPLYLGAQYHFRPRSARWIPYARLDLGVAYLESVDVSFGGLRSRYWDSSWVGMFDVGGGLEYRMDSMGIFLDIRARYLGEPDSSLKPLSDSDPSWTLPVTLGFSFSF